MDVGCGVGGSSRFISKKWGTSGTGKEIRLFFGKNNSPPEKNSIFLSFKSLFFYFSFFSGISLSPFQIGKAKEFTESQGLSSKMEYQVADAMKMPFKENSFDLSKYKY